MSDEKPEKPPAKNDFWLKAIGVIAAAAISSIGSYRQAKEESKQSADAGYKTLVATVDTLQDAVMQLQGEIIKLKQPVVTVSTTSIGLGSRSTIGHGAGSGYGSGLSGFRGAGVGGSVAPANQSQVPATHPIELTPPEKLFRKKALPGNLDAAEQYQKSL